MSPNQSYVKKLGQNDLLTGFYRGGQNLPPPATWDAFQMLPLVGLRSAEVSFYRVHNELFGGYEGDLMLKPDDATLNRVRGTFLDFLKREDLEPMKVIFKLSQEFTGK